MCVLESVRGLCTQSHASNHLLPCTPLLVMLSSFPTDQKLPTTIWGCGSSPRTASTVCSCGVRRGWVVTVCLSLREGWILAGLCLLVVKNSSPDSSCVCWAFCGRGSCSFVYTSPLPVLLVLPKISEQALGQPSKSWKREANDYFTTTTLW